MSRFYDLGEIENMNRSQRIFKLLDQYGSKFANPQNKELALEIHSLSSGTIGSLTGFRDYKEIERFRNSFAAWVSDRPESFKDWMDAYYAFMKHFNIQVTNKGKAEPREIKYKLWFEEQKPVQGIGPSIPVKIEDQGRKRAYRPSGWQLDPEQIKTDKVQFWRHGVLVSGYFSKERAKEMVRAKTAFVMSDQAIGALASDGTSEA